MKFKGVELFERPTCGAVQRVEDLSDEWYLSNIPIGKLDKSKEYDVAMEEFLGEHPELLAKFTIFKKRMEGVRLVMLCTNLSYREVVRLQDKLAYEDYEKLKQECKAIIKAESVDDFLERLKIDTSTPPDEEKQETSVE
jgi:hypothetical protein